MRYKVSETTGLSPWYSGNERYQQKYFKQLLERGDVVFDVGANWGLHTLCLSSLVGSSGRVFALEPYTPVYSELIWHISANHCTNVVPLPIAAMDRDGEATFVPGQTMSTGKLIQRVTEETVSVQNKRSVVCNSLDTLIHELAIDQLALIKIDVEGAEGSVLAGAEGVIRTFHPYFIIELHNPTQDVFVAQFLIERGYQLRRLLGPPIARTDVGWPSPKGVWGTIVAVPPGSSS